MTYDVVTIGNALVDVLAYEDDAFITRTGVERGAMTMVDADRSDEIYAEMGPVREASGGSAANTAAGVASFSALYYAVASAVDSAYRDEFVDRLTKDLEETFRERAEYLGLIRERDAALPSAVG